MDPVDQLLYLRQGCLSIEEYVHQFCELSYKVPLYDEVLFIDLFHFGLREPTKSLFLGREFNGSLRDSMDQALLLCGSPFTVGEAESLPEMATIPEPRQVTADIPESSQVTSDLHEAGQVTVDRHESSQVTIDPAETGQLTADLHES